LEGTPRATISPFSLWTLRLVETAREYGWDFKPEEVAFLAPLAREQGGLFWRAWGCFVQHGAAFVEVTPKNFASAYEHWVRLSGPAVIR
jgi:hypothetical protein